MCLCVSQPLFIYKRVPGFTCDQFIRVLKTTVSHKITAARRPMRAEAGCARASTRPIRSQWKRKRREKETREEEEMRSWPRPLGHVGRARWKPLTSMSLAGTSGVCQYREGDANSVTHTIRHSCAKRALTPVYDCTHAAS